VGRGCGGVVAGGGGAGGGGGGGGGGGNCKIYQPIRTALFSSITSRHCGMVHCFGSTVLAVHNKIFTKFILVINQLDAQNFVLQ